MASTVPIDTHRQLTAAQLREVQALLAKAAHILDCAPRALAPGDREVGEQLLPAWHAVHGATLMTVAELRQAPPGTPLADVLAAFLGRWPDKPHRGAQAFGNLLVSLTGHGVAGFTVRKLPVTSGGVALWVCSPL